MAIIDISDLDLIDLILNLWRNMKPAAFFLVGSFVHPPLEPSREEVQQALNERRQYIDHLAGHRIKTHFSDLTKVDTRLYDCDGGDGAFERIVADMRA